MIRTLSEPGQAFATVDVHPSGGFFATGDFGFKTRLWNPEDGLLLRILEGHRNRAFRVAFRPDGARLATASAEGTIRLWGPRE